MDQSQSDVEVQSDCGDKYVMFDIPEEIVEPEVHPGLNPDQMEDFGGSNESLEPDGHHDDSALYEASYEPPVAICQKSLFSFKNSC